MNKKSQIRKEVKEQLKLMNTTNLSLHINDSLLSLPEVHASKTICCYVSTGKEVETDSIISSLLKNHTIAVPKIANGHLRLYAIQELDQLQLGSYGIREPITTTEISVNEVDCFIIPGLAFDRQGTRLGRGKGYYDRLLQHTSAIKIGLSFSVQIYPLLPKNSYDIVMNIIVTEGEIIRL